MKYFVPVSYLLKNPSHCCYQARNSLLCQSMNLSSQPVIVDNIYPRLLYFFQPFSTLLALKLSNFPLISALQLLAVTLPTETSFLLLQVLTKQMAYALTWSTLTGGQHQGKSWVTLVALASLASAQGSHATR